MTLRPTHALISRSALRHNIAALRKRLGPDTRIMGIAKADCYGHSARICVPTMLECGVDIFGVATAQEAAGLRELGVNGSVVVLPPPLPGEYGMFAEHDLEATISNERMAEELAAAASATGRRLRVHLFVNTGMGRNGVEPSQALNLLRRVDTLESLEMVGFASHFATSDEPGNPFTAAQLEVFETTLREALAEGFTFRDIHIANSGGILNFGASRYTMVRPGLALYGFHPTPELQTESDLRPVMTLRTIVGNVTRMPAGVSISYGRRYHTTAETLIGTLPIGYADGFMRILTNNAEVVIGGRRYPVVGTVCMDEVMVDLGPGSNVRPGDEAIVMGTQGTETISGWELARRAQTIPYEICSNVSKRVPRVAHE